MACRNLTKKFIDIRSGAKANRSLALKGDSDEGLLRVLFCTKTSFIYCIFIIVIYYNFVQQPESSTNWKSAKNTLPPAWVDQIEQAEEDVSKIQSRSKLFDYINWYKVYII